MPERPAGSSASAVGPFQGASRGWNPPREPCNPRLVRRRHAPAYASRRARSGAWIWARSRPRYFPHDSSMRPPSSAPPSHQAAASRSPPFESLLQPTRPLQHCRSLTTLRPRPPRCNSSARSLRGDAGPSRSDSCRLEPSSDGASTSCSTASAGSLVMIISTAWPPVSRRVRWAGRGEGACVNAELGYADLAASASSRRGTRSFASADHDAQGPP